ncbi:MAG: ABC transporter ATP-binding protein [Candidatus Omnitrophota bacterium]
MIELQNISKYFLTREKALNLFAPPKKVTALENVNLKVNKGEIAAVLGPNGAGKTTLLKIMCGLIIPDRGTVTVQGSLNYLSGETFGFYPQLTAWQNLEFFSAFYNLPSLLLWQRVQEYKHIISLSDFNKPFWNYSTGQKHSLAMLRLLVFEPDIIILDEPTINLDPDNSMKLRGMLRRLCSEFSKTVIFATHSLYEAGEIAQRVVILQQGKLVCNCDISRLQNQNPSSGGHPLEKLYFDSLREIKIQ